MSVQDDMLRSQCLNIVFNNLNARQVNLEFKDLKGNYPNIELGIEIAERLYDEIKKVKK